MEMWNDARARTPALRAGAGRPVVYEHGMDARYAPKNRPIWGIHRLRVPGIPSEDGPMPELLPILVAEDDDDDFHFLRLAIRGASIENPILRFRDGSELIKFLEQVPPSELGETASSTWLLLLDIGMPLVNGFDVLKWIGSHQGLPQLRAVVLSGFYHPVDVERAMALGATEYLVKPITRQTLTGIIARQALQTART